MRRIFLALVAFVFAISAVGQSGTAVNIPKGNQIQPAELNALLAKPGAKPLMLQVGSKMMFAQAHIPGAEYVGNLPENIKARMAKVEKSQAIVLYCGCCPWGRCPNVGPSFELLKSLGFTNVKALYLETDFGTDWAAKGYAVAH